MMRWTFAFVVLGCLLAAAGCASDWGTASGVVTQDGVALKKGVVTFHSVGGGADAYANIGPDGSFRTMTGSVEGLKIGDYVVTVVDQTIPESGSTEAVKILTPKKYASPKTTDLKVTIKAGANKLDFELKK